MNKHTSSDEPGMGGGKTPATPRAKNVKVNDDGTISPIDPNKPSSFSTDFSERGVIRAILLNMEWCHAVTTDSLEKAVQAIEQLLIEARGADTSAHSKGESLNLEGEK